VQLLRNLETSQRFVAPRLSNEAAQKQQEGNRNAMQTAVPGAVEFDILSGYNPLPAAVSMNDTVTKTKRAGGTR
jgi:type IV pilus assembly protein PilN